MKLEQILAAAAALTVTISPAFAWDIPPDNGTMPRAAIEEILKGSDYLETSAYKQAIDFIDFSANGQNFTQVVVTLTPDKPRLRNGKKLVVVGGELQNFTQVVVTLTPDKPRLRNGKKLVVVGGEPGSEYAMDFVTTVEGK